MKNIQTYSAHNETEEAVAIRNAFIAKGLEAGYEHYSVSMPILQLTCPVDTFIELMELHSKILATAHYKLRGCEELKFRRGVVIFGGDNFICKLNFDPTKGPSSPGGGTTRLTINIDGFGKKEDIDHIIDIIKANTKKPEPEIGSVYMLMADRNGCSFKSLPNKITDHLESRNYSPEVMVGFNRIVEDLKNKHPKGRIGIFDGAPGTGKTFLIRGLLTTVTETLFVFVSPKDLVNLTGPEILPALIDFASDFGEDNKSITLLVEDADECIAPRGSDNMSAISSVLNLGDGILGQLLDIRIIMTTNAKRSEMDSAITRPGRLSALIHVDKLPTVQANMVYNRLLGNTWGLETEPFTQKTTLAEVYQKAFDAGYIPVTKEQPIGFQTESKVVPIKQLLKDLLDGNDNDNENEND